MQVYDFFQCTFVVLNSYLSCNCVKYTLAVCQYIFCLADFFFQREYNIHTIVEYSRPATISQSQTYFHALKSIGTRTKIHFDPLVDVKLNEFTSYFF